jgi:site-specific DNA-cytosine methylase
MRTPFSFADLFSGIGGFHRGCAARGGECRAACEIDVYAREVYAANYGVVPHDDIRTMAPLEGLDLLCAGFPCQSHSTLGLRKGLGDSRGRLFYDLCRFIERSRPKAFLLENVKGLLESNGGRTFDAIIRQLEGLGYTVAWGVLDSADFGLPQHRERVYIVGCGVPFDFGRLLATRRRVRLETVLDRAVDPGLDCAIFEGAPLLDPPKTTACGFVLRAQLSNFTNRKLFSSHGIVGTISTGSPPPIYDEAQKRIRHLSVAELKRCQGFPASHAFPDVGGRPVSRSTVVHYIGNAVSVNVIAAIVGEMRRQGLF